MSYKLKHNNMLVNKLLNMKAWINIYLCVYKFKKILI